MDRDITTQKTTIQIFIAILTSNLIQEDTMTFYGQGLESESVVGTN